MKENFRRNVQSSPSNYPFYSEPAEYLSQYKLPYTSPTPGEFPLIGIDTGKVVDVNGELDPNRYFSEAFLSIIKESGLNCVQAEVSYVKNSSGHPIEHPLMESIANCNKTATYEVVRIWRYTFPNIPSSMPYDSATARDMQTQSDLYKAETEAGEAYLNDWKIAVEYVYPYKAVGAYHLYDEPNVRYFKWAARVKDAIIEKDKWLTLIYDNLFPLEAEKDEKKLSGLAGREDGLITSGPLAGSGQKITYAYYLDEYERIFAPAVWCYDCYLLAGCVNEQGNPISKLSTFLKNLEVIRDQAYKNLRPFWVTVRGLYKFEDFVKYENISSILEPEFGMKGQAKALILAALRCEIFSSIAGGAQGVNFWAMVARPNDEYFWAPLYYPFTQKARQDISALLPATTKERVSEILAICKDNKSYDYSSIQKSSLFDEVKWVASEVRNLQSLFLGAVNENVWYKNGDDKDEDDKSDESSTDDELSKYGIKKFGKSQKWMKVEINNIDDELFIGFLTNIDKRIEIMVVVNFSLENNCQVLLKFSKEGVVEHTMRNGIPIPSPAPGLTSYKTVIRPGDWRVFSCPRG
ncbi:MAG: hypothetical protein HDS31_02610 [Bacteroides sp.]|nr:hypothetical protein [Bacteroides sp.]